jgi:2-polyprenyl-3-methyl-5-hydroxy-6-metoxy-1,4-benzoquinol methylase
MTPRRFLAKVFRRIAYEIDHSLFDQAAKSVAPVSPDPASHSALSSDFDPLAVPLRDNKLAGWFNEARRELYTGFEIGPQDVVADIGCGTGMHARFCADQGARVILVEADEAKLNTARARWAADDPCFESHLHSTIPFPIADGRCTRIVCNEVLEHVEDPAAFLAELKRIGAPGARYLLCVPAPFSEHVLKNIAHPSYFEPPNHIRIIESEDFQRMVTDAGLIVESESSYGAYWAIRCWLWWCDPQPSIAPRHPVLDHLAFAWNSLLDSASGPQIKRGMDRCLPKSQVIVARKS